jgi:ribosomal protein S4
MPTSDPNVRNFSAPDDAPRLDLLVAGQLDLSRNQAATLIAGGHVLVDGRRERASYKARAGESITVKVEKPRGIEVLGEDIALNIVFEDDDVLVVDKPAGMVVHPAPGNWTGTLVNALKGRGGPLAEGADENREGIVHRLDKETSGLLLVAKNDRSPIRRAELGSSDRRSHDDREADRSRSARPKAHGSRQYRSAGEDGSHPACALRFRRSAESPSLYGTDTPDPSASLFDRASGRW